MSTSNDKLKIYKMRIATLIDEHADALSQAQEFYKQLQEATQKISELEEKLGDRDVQEEDSEPKIINSTVAPTKK